MVINATKKGDDAKATLDKIKNENIEIKKELADLNTAKEIYRWSVITVFILLLLTICYPLIATLFKLKFTEAEETKIKEANSDLLSDTLRHYYTLRHNSVILKRTVFLCSGITIIFIILLMALNLIDYTFNLTKILHEDFIKFVAGLGVPLAFIFGIYANAEKTKLELSKYLLGIENKIPNAK